MENREHLVPDHPIALKTEEVGSFNGGERYMVISINSSRSETLTDIDDHGYEYDYLYTTFVKLGKIHTIPPYTIVAHDKSLCSIINYTGTEAKVIIPWKLDEKMVVAINANVFQNNSTIEEIQIPSLVGELGSCFFKDCSSLTKVTIPNSIREISSDAFLGCSKISRIMIGRKAYERCKSSLPKEVEIQFID